MRDSNPEQPDSNRRDGIRRRDLFRLAGVAGLGALTIREGSTPAVGADARASSQRERRPEEARIRRETTTSYNIENRPATSHPTNGDEQRFAPGGEHFENDDVEGNYFASFSKGLPHRESGEVVPSEFETLRDALQGNGNFSDVREPNERPLVNPEASMSFNHRGIDPNDGYVDPAPKFDRAETAAEMVELYWQVLLRDVKFSEFENSNLARAAAAELSGLEDFTGPENGTVTPETLFRNNLAEVTKGPYISQFLLKDFQRGPRSRDQKLLVPRDNRDFLTDFDEWLDIQNGVAPSGAIQRTTPGAPLVDVSERTGRERHIITGRDLATYVRLNASQQPYLVAAHILQDQGPPLDDGVPTNNNVPDSFIDFGCTEYQSVVTGIVHAHMHAAWYHKWRVHRRPRPEEFGGRVHQVKTGARIDGQDASERYPIHSQLLDSEALERTHEQFGTWLPPQAYPEGSPTHPSYPAGHGVTAGSCATVLKAFFDGDATIDNPVRAVEIGGGGGRGRSGPTGTRTELEPITTDLTVRGEVHKLAMNASIGRNRAGIHYRTDASNAYRLGERIAVSVLRDHLHMKSRTAYGSDPLSFTFTTFDGEEVTITPDSVEPASAFDPPLY